MELLHPTRASAHQFPAIVIPSHGAFSSRTLTNRKKKNQKENHSTVVFSFDVLSFRRTATQLVSPLHASASNSTLLTQEAETPFKSSFDEYLKAMESAKTRKVATRERKKDSRDGSRVQIGEFDDQVKSTEFIHTGRVERKERERKEKASKGQIGSSEVSSKRGLKDFSRVEGDGPKYNLKKFDALELNGSEVSVNLRLQEKKGNRLNKTTPDRFDSDEFLEDDGVVHGRRRITRMEMEERIQKLARCLNGADIDMPEWMFSKMMRSAQIRFCDHSILRVIQFLGKLGNWRRVLQVIEWLQMRERYKSHKLRYVYTAALDTLGKAKRPVEALNVFCTMQRQKCTYPDIVAYHCIAVTLGQAGHMKELFDVMDSMRSVPKNFKISALVKSDPRLEPDIVVYNAVLNACIRQKQWEGAFWVLQQLKKAGLKLTSTTYGLVMEVMLACGKYNLVHDFFKKVQRSSIPNALTYRVVLNALWREGRTDEAIDAVQDMERRGIVGSASLYYDLARCLCSAGRCDKALIQVDKICKVASKPLVVTYTGLIQACLDAGKIEGGAYIFNHMHKYCSPNLITCNIMLKAFLQHGMLNEATELFQKMLESSKTRGSIKEKERITPDIYTFNTIMEALVEHEKWDDFENAYEQMLYHGHHFITKRHLWMAMKASSAGKVGPIEMTWNHLMQEDRIPPPALVKERFRLKLENRELMAALSTLTSHPSTHQQAFSKEAWLELIQRSLPRTGTELVQLLIRDLESYLSSGESLNLVLLNLLESCKETVRNNDAGVDQTNCIERLQAVLST